MKTMETMTMIADTCANAERAPHDQPVRIAPLVPDLVPVEHHWPGPAGAAAEFWRERALRAEAELERLRRRGAR